MVAIIVLWSGAPGSSWKGEKRKLLKAKYQSQDGEIFEVGMLKAEQCTRLEGLTHFVS
jgi:CRISPR/Cas system CSM-associated protein Csm3 (group 7 of RAMP superfamily)